MTNKRNIIKGRRLKLYNAIANYSFEVEFIKGTNNLTADYLSKNHNEELLNKQLIEIKFLQESIDPPKQGEWVTIAKRALVSIQRPNKVYVVFKGSDQESSQHGNSVIPKLVVSKVPIPKLVSFGEAKQDFANTMEFVGSVKQEHLMTE